MPVVVVRFFCSATCILSCSVAMPVRYVLPVWTRPSVYSLPDSLRSVGAGFFIAVNLPAFSVHSALQ